MFAESVQEDIFRENEFVETRFRGRLLPVWVKLLMGISAFVAIFCAAAIIYVPFSPGHEETPTWILVTLFSIGGTLIAGLLPRILLLLEKRWAIIGMMIAALVNLAVLGLLLAAAKTNSTSEKVMTVCVCALTVLELVLFIRLIVIFKRWRSYMSERNNR